MKMQFRKFLEAGEHEPYVSIKADIPLDSDVLLLNRLFQQAGYDLYVVGGAVRDYLYAMNKGKPESFSPKDIDLATNARPDQIIKVLSDPTATQAGIGYFEQGAAFGVIAATVNSEVYEIATFRQDAKTGDGRRPDYVTYSTPGEDAKRRDLTINALFYHIDEKEIRDYNGGQGLDDIRKGVARTVGDPFERFNEDRLRVLRLIRFFARNNPGGPEELEKDARTADAIRHFKSLPDISPERIKDEFVKGLKSAIDPVNYLKIYSHFGLLETLFPRLRINQNMDQLGQIDDKLKRNPKIVLAWLLKQNDPKIVQRSLNALKYPSDGGKGSEYKLTNNVEFFLSLLNFNPNNITDYIKAKSRLRPTNKVNTDTKNAYDQEIVAWAKLNGLDMNAIAAFLQYEPRVNSMDSRLQGLTGASIGQKMRELETAEFKRNMSSQ